jgi:hypothetical protein
MDKPRSEPQPKSFKTEVEELLAKQALALNYQHGMTSRIMPTASKGSEHAIQLMLDLTHSSLDFDMVFTVLFADDPAAGVSWNLAAPDAAGGKVWEETHRSADDFRNAVAGIPYFVLGFFAGRSSRATVGTSGAPGE